MSTGTTANGQSVTHEFPCGQSFIVSVLITYPRGDQCPGEIEFETPPCNCNKFGTDTDEQTFPVGSDTWRIDCKIWIDRIPWFTTGDVGSRSISRRKGTFGRFYKRNVDEICASLGGHYLRKPDCNQIFPGIEECETNKGNVQRNVNDNAARKDPGMLFSRHRMVVKGVPCVFSKNGGRLVLE